MIGQAIRLIKVLKCECKHVPCTCHLGEKYLKENAEWLGYVVGNVNGADATNALKNSRDLGEQSFREDMRSLLY